jgi:dienelactone hydrolase
MAALASEGVFCVLLQMPFQLAVLDVNAAQGIAEEYPAVDQWYLGGHSLGGSMAAAYLEANFSEFAGLVLLGSYSTVDLSQTPLRVLSLYGSEDRVMNREKYDRYKCNLPEALTEIVLEGGCHAGFGMYGAQKGDGVPTVSPEEQIDRSADLIFRFMQGES